VRLEQTQPAGKVRADAEVQTRAGCEVTLRREQARAVLRSICYPVIADCLSAPINIKHATTLTALVRLFTHRIIDWHGEQLAAVRALNFRGARDSSREAEFVVENVVGEEH